MEKAMQFFQNYAARLTKFLCTCDNKDKLLVRNSLRLRVGRFLIRSPQEIVGRQSMEELYA